MGPHDRWCPLRGWQVSVVSVLILDALMCTSLYRFWPRPITRAKTRLVCWLVVFMRFSAVSVRSREGELNRVKNFSLFLNLLVFSRHCFFKTSQTTRLHVIFLQISFNGFSNQNIFIFQFVFHLLINISKNVCTQFELQHSTIFDKFYSRFENF